MITATTQISAASMQQDPFHWAPGDPCPQPFQLNDSILAPCTELKHFDYFSGSEYSYALSLAFLGIFTIGE